MTFDLIIFDCDGTLVDTEYLNCKSCSEVLIEAGLPEYTDAVIYRDFVGIALAEIFSRIEQRHDMTLPDDMAERIIARVGKNAGKFLQSLDGAADAVVFATQNHNICVASNGERPNVVQSIEMSGLDEFFTQNVIFTAAQVEHGKPAPDLFLYAAKQCGTSPEKCLVIEDTVAGVTAGKSAGMTVIGYTGAHTQTEGYADKLRKAGADVIMSDWKGFQSLIHKLSMKRAG